MKINSIKSLNLKGMFTKLTLAGALAGAVFMAAPQKAEAQSFHVGIGFRAPVYGPRPVYGPAFYGPGYYGERRHEEFVRHERWERDHRFHGGFYR